MAVASPACFACEFKPASTTSRRRVWLITVRNGHNVPEPAVFLESDIPPAIKDALYVFRGGDFLKCIPEALQDSYDALTLKQIKYSSLEGLPEDVHVVKILGYNCD